MRVFCAFFMFAWKFARKVQGAPQGVGLGFFFVIKSKRCQSLKLRGACTLCQWVFLSLKPIKMCEIASKTGALYFLQMVMGDDKSIYLQNPWFESFFVFLITFYVFAPVRVRSVSRFAFGQVRCLGPAALTCPRTPPFDFFQILSPFAKNKAPRFSSRWNLHIFHIDRM